MKFKLIILINLSDTRTYNVLKRTFSYFLKELNEIHFLDVSNLLKSSVYVNVNEIGENITLDQPKTNYQLKNSLKKKNYIYMYCIDTSPKYLFINFLLARSKVKKFILSNIGYNPDNFNYFQRNIFEKLKIFIKLRLFYFVTRFLVIFNLSPKIDFFFESSNFVINSIKKANSLKIKKKIPFLNFSYYLNLIKVNSKHYDNVFYSAFDVEEKNIIYVDGNYNHADRILRDGPASIEDQRNFFQNTNKNLNRLKDLYKKDVIICLHPSTDEEDAKKNFDKKFKIVKYQTEKFVSSAFIVVFHESSSIIQAILLKKKIIAFAGDCLGSYVRNRINLYSEILRIKKYELDNFDIEEKNKEAFISELETITDNYNSYVTDNIVFNKGTSGIKQVIKHLSQI
jgi:hypothetical protein